MSKPKEVVQMGNGGSIEQAMSLDEANTAYYNDNDTYGRNEKWTINDFPKYISHNGKTFEKGTPKKTSALR